MDDKQIIQKLEKENDSLKSEITSKIKENDSLKSEITSKIKENDFLVKTQQELKAKIKQLTELPPKVISGHESDSVKYIRQSRTKSD